MKRKQSEETDNQRKTRLQNQKNCMKRKHSAETMDQREDLKKQKRAETLSKQESEINQQEYLNMFDNCQNGSIEEQSWAKANIDKFHKTLHYNTIQCAICHEAWPLKSKPKSSYVCSSCSRDKKCPKKFSCENSMIPSSVPLELLCQ